MQFYDVKTRKFVEVPDRDVKKIRFDTKRGYRYALYGVHNERRVTRFVSQKTFEESSFPEG